MKYFVLLLFLFAWSLVNAEKNHEHHEEQPHLHARSHQNKTTQEKSVHKQHVANRHNKKSEVRHHNSHFKYRDFNQNSACNNSGSYNNSTEIKVYYNENLGLIVLSNEAARVAAIANYTAGSIELLDGQNGHYILEDLNSNRTYSIRINPLNDTRSFDEFLENPSNLYQLSQRAVQDGESSDLFNPPQSIADEVHRSFSYLEDSVDDGNLLNQIHFVRELKGPLGLLYRGNGTFTIHNDLNWFVNLNVAIAFILDNSAVSLDSIGPLDAASIFGANSGVEAFNSLSSQLVQHIDLAKAFDNIKNSPQKRYQEVSVLNAISNAGIDGIYNILRNLQLLGGPGTLIQFIDSIFNYKPVPGVNISYLLKVVNASLNILREQNRRYHNLGGLAGLYQLLDSFTNNNLTINNINATEIIDLILSRNPVESIQLIIRIISEALSPHNLRQWIQIVLNNTSEIIPGIVSNLNIRNIFSQIIRIFNEFLSNVSALTSRIPIIGPIIERGINAIRNFNSSSLVEDIQSLVGNGTAIISRIPIFGSIIGGSLNGTSLAGDIQSLVGNGTALILRIPIIGPIFDQLLKEAQHLNGTALAKDIQSFVANLGNGNFGEPIRNFFSRITRSIRNFIRSIVRYIISLIIESGTGSLNTSLSGGVSDEGEKGNGLFNFHFGFPGFASADRLHEISDRKKKVSLHTKHKQPQKKEKKLHHKLHEKETHEHHEHHHSVQ